MSPTALKEYYLRILLGRTKAIQQIKECWSGAKGPNQHWFKWSNTAVSLSVSEDDYPKYLGEMVRILRDPTHSVVQGTATRDIVTDLSKELQDVRDYAKDADEILAERVDWWLELYVGKGLEYFATRRVVKGRRLGPEGRLADTFDSVKTCDAGSALRQ